MIAGRLLVLASAALSACTTGPPPPASPGPAIAVTIDDLPVHAPIPAGMTAKKVNAQMIAALRAAEVPGVHAFINGASVERDPSTLAALEAWREAGIPLANHGWAHRNLNDMTSHEFEQELVRNEPLLRRLNAAEKDWRWFRFPFLAEGDDHAKRLEARAVAARHNYRIAGVSMDFSDWKWTAPYARCLAIGDAAAIAELERLYMHAASESLVAKRELARRLYGRDIPHVLLLHVGAFSARMMPQLIAMYRRANVRFISLEQAQADQAYREDMDPTLPPRSAFIGQRAAVQGIDAPPEPDPTALLEAICR